MTNTKQKPKRVKNLFYISQTNVTQTYLQYGRKDEDGRSHFVEGTVFHVDCHHSGRHEQEEGDDEMTTQPTPGGRRSFARQ